MLKKYTLLSFCITFLFYFSCTNLVCSQRNFQLDEKCLSQLKKSADSIHDYYKNFCNLENERFRYEFDEPKAIKNSIEEIHDSLSNFLFQDVLIKNNFFSKYNWLMKNSNPVIREAAAYYYSANIVLGRRNNSNWQTNLIDEFFLLLEDENLDVKRAASFSLSTLALKAKLHQTLKNKISKKINSINIQDSDPFIFGYSIFYLVKFKHNDKDFSWKNVTTYYNNQHRFVRLCTIKAFQALIDNATAASWANGLAHDLSKSEDQEKLKDFQALGIMLASKREYSQSIFNIIWNHIRDENIDKKLTGFSMMINLFKGDSILFGDQVYVSPFHCIILSRDKVYTFQQITTKDIKSDNPILQKSVLNLSAQFVKRIDDQFDFEVIQYMAQQGFSNSDVNVKIAALKIIENLALKNFDLQNAAQVANKTWINENIDLKAAALSIYKALVIKNQFLSDSLNVFLEGIEILLNQKIDNNKFKKNLFKLGKTLAAKDYNVDIIIQTIQKFENLEQNTDLLFLDMCKELASHPNFADYAFELSKKYLTGNYYNNITKKALEIIDKLLSSNQKINAIQNLAEEMVDIKSDIKKFLIGLKIQTKLSKQNPEIKTEMLTRTFGDSTPITNINKLLRLFDI